MIPFRLTLDYTLETGWIAPFISGLGQGKAVARACQSCAAVSFPPQRVCSCGMRDGDWLTLAGTATIHWRTHGADGDFALAQFDGATTQTVVRLVGCKTHETRGKLVVADADAPALCLAPLRPEDST